AEDSDFSHRGKFLLVPQRASGVPKNFVDLSRPQSPLHSGLTVNRSSFIHKRSCRYTCLGARIIHPRKVARLALRS
ncbi:hypothetical protein K435DRAFT_787450, partial [Dendrothele bispora CBS 962.96]